MARPRNRNTHTQFLLYSTCTTLGYRTAGLIDYRAGEAKVEAGEMLRVYDVLNNHIGFQPIEPAPPVTASSGRSNPSLGRREIEANAGLYGNSRTEGMSDEKRLLRTHPVSGRQLPAEDFVEITQEKVRVWPLPTNLHGGRHKKNRGDRAVRVYPKAPAAQKAKR